MSDIAIVRPDRAHGESAGLAAAFLLIIAAMALYLSQYGRTNEFPELADWQLSAFRDLGPVDQSIFTSLRVAGEEAYWEYDFWGEWPTAEKLGEDAAIEPFAQDIGWERNGRVIWEMHPPYDEGQGAASYFGHGGTAPGQGAYLLLIGHAHAGATRSTNQVTVWRHDDPNAAFPDQLTQESLILKGWKEVVPYSGKDEIERIKGVS